MQDDLTGATSTPADDDVRADLTAAFADWGDDEPAPIASEEPSKAEPEAKPADGRARDEKGRFAPKAAEAQEASQEALEPQKEVQATEQLPAQEQPSEAEQEPQSQPVEGRPPPGWSVASKAGWDQLPAHVRADIVKREEEVNNGFAKLRDYKGLDQYANMARQSGTTLESALQNYVGMEQLLRTNPQQGFLAIAKNVGISPQQLAQMFGAAPQAHQNGQQPATQDQSDLDDPYVKAAVMAALAPVREELNSVKTHLQSQQEADQTRKISSAQQVIDEFSASPEYRYFSDVEETINELLEKGIVKRTGDFRKDLATAYEQACLLHPEVREALFNERLSKAEEKRRQDAEKAEAERRAKAEAAKRASVSVRGAPSGTVSTPSGSKGSVHDDLAAAWEAFS